MNGRDPRGTWHVAAAAAALALVATGHSADAGAGPGFAPAARSKAENTNHLMGINLSGPADWNAELPFVDVFRLARRWISQQEGKPWGKGPELALGPSGWVARLGPQCRAETPILTIPRAPTGRYTLLFDGEGEIDLWPADKAKILSREPGRWVVDVSQPGLFFRLAKTTPDNPVRNIRFVMPGHEKSHRAEPFRPGFLQLWRPMNAFRFMDWMHTNGSKVARWPDRPKPDDATWTPKGIPLEVMIDLCNRQLVNPWFCMPHLADDGYIRQFATMVRDRLDPILHVYIEYSNEVWNGMFPQHHYANAKGVELGIGPKERPWECGGHYYAERSVAIFRIWEEVFGSRRPLVRILAWQAANPWWPENIILPWKDAHKHADALAIAPYITLCVRPKGKPSAETVAGWTVDQVLDYAETTALPQCVGWMKAQKAIADQFGLRLVAYEGGQHLVGVGGGENNEAMTKLFHAANRHPRMGTLYRKYHDAWAEAAGDLFCTFASIGGWSKWGSWGLAQHYDDQPDDSPKLKATLDWTAEHPLENEPPAIGGLADATAAVGKPLALEATIADDGKSRMAVLVGWSSRGPAPAAFGDPRAAATTVTFAQPGTYTLLLRASDGFARSEKAIAVQVK